MGFISRMRDGWNAFLNKDPTSQNGGYYGYGSSYRPDRIRLSGGNERSITTTVFNRIGIDAAAIDMKHVKLDDNNRFIYEMSSGLNRCLSVEANIDQTGRALIQDIVMSMLDEGSVAVVPVDTNTNPIYSGGFDILSLRTGKIMEWKPDKINVEIYNERTGEKERLWLPKKVVAIIENPLYAIINEPNSTMHRLIRKLAMLDIVDEQSCSGKLNLIVQLPYVIKTEARRKEAEKRRMEMQQQLADSTYGIAYADGTEKITQLNRPIDNNLQSQIEYLTKMFYSQTGISQAVLDGTADEKEMLNYYNRTIEPILSAIADEFKRKFLSKTAITQKQSVEFFRDPFRLVPISAISEIADKFTRNELMSTNEFRQIIGMKPSSDPSADELRNKNLNKPADELPMDRNDGGLSEFEEEIQNEEI